MQVPLEIAFHNTESEKWAEELIATVLRLEDLYGRLISCRVRVDRRAKNSSGTIPPVVRIELGIPAIRSWLSVTSPNISNANLSIPICATRSMKRFALPSAACAISRSSASGGPDPLARNDEPFCTDRRSLLSPSGRGTCRLIVPPR